MTAIGNSLVRATNDSKARAALHVVAYCLAFFPVWFILPMVGDIVETVAPEWLGTIVQAGFYLGAVVVLTWAFCRFLHRGSLADLGLKRRGWARASNNACLPWPPGTSKTAR
jgi:hypothetical protein